MKSALKVLKIAAASLALLYLSDYLSIRFRIPNREPLTTVQIEVYYAIRLKGHKTEYIRADPETDTCVRSLFPQVGCLPCWYVTRHTEKWVDVGGDDRFSPAVSRPERLSKRSLDRANASPDQPWRGSTAE
jgi:hypothetical protein